MQTAGMVPDWTEKEASLGHANVLVKISNGMLSLGYVWRSMLIVCSDYNYARAADQTCKLVEGLQPQNHAG